MHSTRTLVNAVRVVLAIVLVEAAVSILAGWPHQFGGQGDPHRMVQDFVSNGTALAPPLFIVLGLIVVAALSGRQDRWGVIAVVLATILGVIMVVGSLGEALAAATPDVPRAVQLGGGLINVTASVLLCILALWGVTQRVRRPASEEARSRPLATTRRRSAFLAAGYRPGIPSGDSDGPERRDASSDGAGG